MSDPRVLKWLRKIDANIDLMRKERDRELMEIDDELDEHRQRLDGHDAKFKEHTKCWADHERRLRRLEKRRG